MECQNNHKMNFMQINENAKEIKRLQVKSGVSVHAKKINERAGQLNLN